MDSNSVAVWREIKSGEPERNRNFGSSEDGWKSTDNLMREILGFLYL